MTYIQIFGGDTVAPANASFLALAMAADVDLQWPIEQAMSGLVVADTIEVTAAGPGLNINLPDARQVSTGYTAVFNNIGGQTVTVRNAIGGTIISLVSGTAWVVYLADNSIEAGVFRVFQLGASVSTAVAGALAGSGLKAIGTTLNQSIPVRSIAVTPINAVDSDRAQLLNWTGGVGILNLPAAGTVGSDWFLQVRNSGTGDLTVTPPSGTIDGAVNKTFGLGTSASIVTDGTNYFTLGFGSGSGGGGGGSFDFTTINVAGAGNYTLSGAELNRIAYRFTGVLTGDRTIIVPGSIQQYWITNATTGAFKIFFKKSAQAAPGVQVLINNAAILYCDGGNVVDADSATVTFPIAVALGGTGAVNAATARTNLGAGAVGSNIFVAATQALAQTALGITLAGTNIWAALQEFQGANPAIRVSGTTPGIHLVETDGAVDNKGWRFIANSEQLAVQLVDDAYAGTTNIILIDRTSMVVDTVNFANGVLQYGGIEVGYRNMPRITVTVDTSAVDLWRGRYVRYAGVGGHTITIPAATLQQDGGFTIQNSGGASINIAAGVGEAQNWYNGSGTVSVGTRVLAVGGICTIYIESGAVHGIFGTGLS